MNEERRKGDRRIPPAVAQHLVEERSALLAQVETLTDWYSNALDTIRALEADRDRLKVIADNYSALNMDAQAELAELKAQSSGVVLRDALVKIIEMNRQHAEDQYGDAGKAESWSCVTIAREALNSSPVGADETWPKQQCPVTGQITDVDPADMGVQQPSGVVLPERADENADDPYEAVANGAHNTCLDEVARLNHCRAQSAASLILPEDWEDRLFEEMTRRFELSKRDDKWMCSDDTQIGVEFACKQICGMIVANAAQAVPDDWWHVIHDALLGYRLATMHDEDGDGYPLIDALTCGSPTVSGGIEECRYLADSIWNDLCAAAQSAKKESGDE